MVQKRVPMRMCAGCGSPIAVRTVLRQVEPGDHAIVCNATGCLEVSSFLYPYTAYEDSYIHTAFECAGSTMSGVEAAYKYTKRALNAGKHVVTANKQLVAEKGAELLALAKKRGLIVLTDSDGAGFLIRGKLSSSIPPEQIKHAYIPDILGKERRKAAPSKEGKLGVEGMELSVLRQALERAGATVEDGPAPPKETAPPLTKADLFQLGLTGGEDSAARRKALQKRLGLPERLSANGLLQALNTLYSREELRAALEKEE